jgi:hypothetical protein
MEMPGNHPAAQQIRVASRADAAHFQPPLRVCLAVSKKPALVFGFARVGNNGGIGEVVAAPISLEHEHGDARHGPVRFIDQREAIVLYAP